MAPVKSALETRVKCRTSDFRTSLIDQRTQAGTHGNEKQQSQIRETQHDAALKNISRHIPCLHHRSIVDIGMLSPRQKGCSPATD